MSGGQEKGGDGYRKSIGPDDHILGAAMATKEACYVGPHSAIGPQLGSTG